MDVQNDLRVWVTGAGGLIGNYLVNTASTSVPRWQVLGITRDVLDLTNFAALRVLFQKSKPDLIIHCAAMSRSPACQVNPALAWKVNVDATAEIANLASEIPLIFFSSDLVFDGRKGDYVETDEPVALSAYAETKIAGEKVILQNPRHTVIRTSLNAGKSPTGDRGFNEEMTNAWRAGKSLKLFVDEFRCPIPARVTARAIWELARQNATGIFHIGGSEKLSRFEIGKTIAEAHPEVNPGFEAASLKEYQGAPRSPDTSLKCDKIQRLLSFQLPRFRDWVKRHPSEV